MAMNFDKHIKESMDNFELPYDSAAWDAVSKKLDQTMPVTPKSSFKWWGIAATIATVAIVTTYFLTNSAEENTSATATHEEKIGTQATANQQIDTKNSTVTSSSKLTQKEKASITTSTEIKTEEIDKIVEEKTVYHHPKTEPFVLASEMKKVNLIVPSVMNTCAGQTITISNTNESELVLIHPNNKKTIITPHDNIHFGASLPGVYELGYINNGSFISKEQFNVIPSVKTDIEIDENTIENGIPTIHLSSGNTASNYTWDIEKHNTSTSKEVDAHFFYKGTYDVKLTTTSSNGCTTSEKRKIVVNEDYNLLAPNAFSPSDDNGKNETWIPEALKTRNLKFTLVIMDQVDGTVVYQTTDASQPWDGIDARTGNLVTNSTFVWTVKISNPEPGERADYKGVIIRL